MDFQGGTHTVEIQGNNHNVDALFEYYAYILCILCGWVDLFGLFFG